ncbi:hypothetical protein GIB67_039218 [Kingdonia uniflora]|uniref:Uncharacterized protein n=1 Tax=Kingdonia uniflora TaxID=39325 RepID=A0A7J7MM38_9MAGN|nr:hypothetical protein GIB67_039218 [Kingdonia uniflora]
MDSDLWTSRLAAAKREYILHHHHNSQQLDRLSFNDLEVEEEIRPDFPCPYCFEDYDIISLCSHLEDEHSFESRVTICPICSVKVTRDMLNHITLQHGNLFKMQRRRRLRRVALPNSQSLSLLSRDLREAHLQVLLGGGTYRSSNANSSNTLTDSLLSSLVLNFPASETEDVSKSAVTSAEDISIKNVTSTPTCKPRFIAFPLIGSSSL